MALTGGTGFIGRRLVEFLKRRGHHVRLLCRDPVGAPDAETVRGSLDDKEALGRLVDSADVVVHIAGIVQAVRPPEFDRVNRLGTRHVATACAGREVRKFVLVSSLAAREPGASAYAASKKAGEDELCGSLEGSDVIIVRPPAVYGPGDRVTLPVFKQLMAGWLIVPSTPDARFSLIHVDDLVELLGRLIEGPAPSRIVEPDDGTPGGYRWKDLCDVGAELRGGPVRLVSVPICFLRLIGSLADVAARVFDRPMIVSRDKTGELACADWVASTGSLPNWRAKLRFAEGARQTIAWYRDAGWMR